MAPLQPLPVPAALATLRSDHEHNLQAAVEGVQDRQDNLQTQIELMARNLSHMTQQFAAFQEFWMNQAARNPAATPISAPSRAQFPSPSLRSCAADQLSPSSHQPPNPSTPALAFGSFPPPNPSQDFTHVSPTLPHTANNTSPTPQHVPQPFPYQLPATPLNPLFPYRPPKIDLPRFMGDDVMGWLAMAERFLRVNNVPPYERVQTIASLFGPDPSIWMNAFELRHPNPSWEDFSTALLCRFGTGSASEFKGRLAHLQQTGTVEEFITDFTKLSCRTPDWAEHDLIPILIDGLRPELRHDVRALNPTSLADAQRLARCYETRNNALKPSPSNRPRPFVPYTSSRPALAATPAAPPMLSQATATQPRPLQPPTSTPQPYRPFRRFPTPEQRDRRARNLCFNCDEQYTPNHVCKHKFMVILEGPIGEAEEHLLLDGLPLADAPEAIPPEPPLPLCAITSTKLSQVMKIHGSINDTPILVFIVCGSVSNFLNPEITRHL